MSGESASSGGPLLHVVNGQVYDPANGIDGEVRTVAIREGRVVTGEAARGPARVLDARGLLVLPGGVDLHSHIAGPKVNAARKMRPEDHRRAPPVRRTAATRSGVMGSNPSTFATGYAYAGLGYTTVFDAAVPPLGARHAHEELHDTPLIDKGFLVLMGNNEYVLRALRAGEPARVLEFMAWLLAAAKGYGVKAVNPGGVEAWKRSGGNVTGLDEAVEGYDVTPRQILGGLAQAVTQLGLPHPLHVHPNGLGTPGNWATTRATMEALDGHRVHLAHVQFHSYGEDEKVGLVSRAAELVEYVDAHPHVSVDVGQVMFGDTTSLTGDAPLGYYLHGVTGRKWFNGDVELEGGCGIVPIQYRERSRIHATQWAIGLEWLLLARDPWRVVLSTDHPNGASFTSYPRVIRLLMDREYRKEALRRVHPKAVARTRLPDLDREYTLGEIAILTRAAPARVLGLAAKGHLGPGADADLTLLQPRDDWEETFTRPRYVIKAGEIVAEDGQATVDLPGRTLYVEPTYDPALEADLRRWFTDYYTIQFENYPVTMDYLPHPRRIPVAAR